MMGGCGVCFVFDTIFCPLEIFSILIHSVLKLWHMSQRQKKGSYVPNLFVIAGHSRPCDLGLTPAVVRVFCNDQI